MDKALFIVSGRLACDPDFKQTQTGSLFARFAIAVHTPKSNDRELVSFFECIAWETADRCKKFRKGDAVEAWGNFYIEKYTDRNGNQRTMTTLKIKEIYWVSGAAEQNDAVRAKNRKKSMDVGVDEETEQKPEQTESAPDMIDVDPDGDDLPF